MNSGGPSTGLSRPNEFCDEYPAPSLEFHQHQQQQTARLMARQQLEVSSDSPFNTQEVLSQVERAQTLREETDAIKKQLDLVRARLNEFNSAKESESSSNGEKERESTHDPIKTQIDPLRGQKQAQNQQVTSHDSQFHRGNQLVHSTEAQSTSEPAQKMNMESTKLRPLTGKTDCPNCLCDRRRQSVCDNCISYRGSGFQPEARVSMRHPSFLTGSGHKPPESTQIERTKTGKEKTDGVNLDERPLNPAQNSALDQCSPSTDAQAARVNREVVPNQIFTISKSLNEKRAQLGKAIEDLQLMIDKVKKRGERLDEERKVAQLYKEQWRFGPSIGGNLIQSGTANSSTNRTTYQSRLDPQLARDTNSLMGFPNIGPAKKMCRYNTSDTSLNSRFQPSKAARTRLTQSRSSHISSKMPSIEYQDAISNRLSTSKQATSCPSLNHDARSKSLDSLHHVDKLVVATRPIQVRSDKQKQLNGANFHEGKSSSELNLNIEARQPDEAIEEEIEEELDSNGVVEKCNDIEKEKRPEAVDDSNSIEPVPGDHNGTEQDQRIKKQTWVPVFGETEIKNVDRRQPIRKTLVMGSDPMANSREQRSPSSILRQRTGNDLRRGAAMKQRSHSAVSSVMNEASRKLRFAKNLLECDEQDSRTRNQLIVDSRFRAPQTTRVRKQQPGGSDSHPSNRSPGGNKSIQLNDRVQNFISGANGEINRLEELISEQQRAIAKLMKERNTCHCRNAYLNPSTSHETRSKGMGSSPTQVGPGTSRGDVQAHESNNKLIAHLKERLDKTKARLAQTLEEERAKHQQLERKVYSSLRRQSDLRAENEILRKSLSKCIDTCLRDISSTFESLNETLADSLSPIDQKERTVEQPADELMSVAQLISDNRRLKQMQTHIQTIENQRRSIFDELSEEKLRSKQLELQLIQSKLETDNLHEDKRRLERELSSLTRQRTLESAENHKPSPLVRPNSTPVGARPSTSNIKHSEPVDANTSSTSETLEASHLEQSQADLSEKSASTSDEQHTTTTSATLDSIDIYRQYIQSMGPDLEAIRRERRMILGEFDNIKKMLANMND